MHLFFFYLFIYLFIYFSKVVATAHESLALIRTVRAFAKEDYEIEKFEQALQNEGKISSSLGRGIGVLQGLSLLGMTSTITMVLSYGGYLITNGIMTSGQVSEFLFQSFQLQKALMELAKLGGEYGKASSSMNRIDELLSSQPSISLTSGIELNKDSIKGEIVLDHVDFTYSSRPDKKVLNDVCIKIPAGKIYALVGPSGSGKSTLVGVSLTTVYVLY